MDKDPKDKSNDTDFARISQSIDKFAHSFDLLRKTFEETGESRRKFVRKKRIHDYVIIIMTFLGMAAIVFSVSYREHAQQIRSELYSQAIQVTNEINLISAKRALLMNAMSVFRSAIAEGEQYCTNKNYVGNNLTEYQEKLFNAKLSLENAYFKSDGIIVNTAINKLKEFMNIANIYVTHFCEQDSVKKTSLLKIQANVYQLITYQIADLERQTNKFLFVKN